MPTSPLPSELRELLAKPNPAVIGTVTPDGRPNTVATWYLFEDGRILVNMDEGRRRLDYLRTNPRVSLTVLDGEEWYRHVSLHGSVTLADDPDLADIDRISQHYTGSPYAQRDRGRVSAWIEVESWHAWNGGRAWHENAASQAVSVGEDNIVALDELTTSMESQAGHFCYRLATVLLNLTLVGWALLELSLRVREGLQSRGRTDHDRATRILIAVAIGSAIALGMWSARAAPSLRLPGPYRAAGLIVMWLGLAIRVWAIASLGTSFRTTVEVDPEQAVVSSGPYRWVRHPSYTGLLLILSGFGLALGHWPALVACVALPLPALLRRIQVEETELTRVLGEPYEAYRRQTRRLIPGVW